MKQGMVKHAGSLQTLIMKRALALGFLGVASAAVNSQEIATCRNPAGRAFYHLDGAVGKSDSGWTDDKISGGVFTLVRNGKDIDLLYVDIRKKPISSTQDGAIVRILRNSLTTITVLVYYPDGASTEIYSFFKELDGSHRFTLLQNNTGGAAMYPKSSLLVGSCEPINFAAAK